MRAAKRLWIYSGLSVPPGVALVRRPRRAAASTKRVLLLASALLKGLVPPMLRLAQDSESSLHVDLRTATLRDWAQRPWLAAHLSVLEPTTVFVAVDPRDSLARQAVRGRIHKSGASTFWLVPPEIRWHATKRFIPAPESLSNVDAESYAAWAGRAWKMVE